VKTGSIKCQWALLQLESASRAVGEVEVSEWVAEGDGDA
jgi:hypothetical protein